MIDIKKVMFALVAIVFTSGLNAQSNFSIQLNTGLSDVSRSLSGFSGSLQINYSLNPDLNLYMYSGYSNVDKNSRKNFRHGHIDAVKNRHSSGLIESDRNLIPIYFGGSLDIFENNWIRTFANLELGYSYLSYSTFERMLPISSNNGRDMRYRPDRSTREKHSANLFGSGVGLGAAHPVAPGLEVLLTFKLNTSTNFGSMKMLSRKSTFTSLLAGINYSI